MPFVKLDCGILNSTLWFERECREVFLTALLMAEPFETQEPLAQIAIHSLDNTGWFVPPGWYGFVPAAGIGIIHRAQVDEKLGFAALAKLGDPEQSSRSPEFEGRRLVRVDGGFIVLNYMKYRDRDYTAAQRQRRYRQRQRSRRDSTQSHRHITQAEAEAEVYKSSIPRARRKAAQKALGAEKRLDSPPASGPSDVLAERAGRLVERYGELFQAHRFGARYHARPVLDFEEALGLVAHWPDDGRLEKLAVLVLTTDDPWIAGTDRAFKIFALKASWADQRLAEWEARRSA